jgi:hypothetical protein
VISIIVQCDDNVPVLLDALAGALPSNPTLRELSFMVLPFNEDPPHAEYWSPICLALGKNAALKTLKVGGFGSMDESLCTAIQNGIGMNKTLEDLALDHVPLCDDNADLWYRAFSFLRTNETLKSLVVIVTTITMESSCVFAFRIYIATMLRENTSLETLTVSSLNIKIKAEDYLVLIATLEHDKTLKSLNIEGSFTLTLTHDDEEKRLVALLQKNYALESLPGIDLENEAGDVGAILRLNEAGRRYLIEDGSSISKGIKVLSALSNEINCVFLHLLENPTLCDRSAVETAASDSDSTDIDESVEESNTMHQKCR